MDQPFLFAELMEPSWRLEDRLYRELLQRSNKAVLEEIRRKEDEQREYKEFIEKVKQIKEKKKLYIFTLGNEIEEQELKEIKNYKIEAIPQKIYDKYKKTSKISNEK